MPCNADRDPMVSEPDTDPCSTCGGSGRLEYLHTRSALHNVYKTYQPRPCFTCDGTGRIPVDPTDTGNPGVPDTQAEAEDWA